MAENFLTEQKNEKKRETPFETVSKNVTSVGSRLRVVEERYSNIRKKIQMTDESLLDFEKDIRTELKALNQEFLELKRIVSEINDNLSLMSSELKKSVKQTDLKVVEKYVDMWQPMNFVTREELKKHIK
ncbi:hypothetical protein CMO90_04165 [Candidatus Woesearchaeota archaeon]|jgi:septation ring formation regulator EzrA|nr:hypothetical protein [Candidatus Woesearchaeota archaeon]|tara:strand:- start:509 stop:895 length:387 start_codon:yes stop_codon:yes gene_type:complete